MLKLEHISANYKQDQQIIEVLHDINLTITAPNFIVFLGPSGSGKSTLLRLIAGLSRPTTGRILYQDKEVVGPSHERGVVFQGFSLFPWLTVRENIAFPLKMQRMAPDVKRKIVNNYLEITGLKDYAELYPINLSGGMQQRTAIARTLINDPQILLMDEPFSSLDFQIRSQLQMFISEIYETQKKIIIFVTHDIEEALLLADKIYVLSSEPAQIKAEFTVPFTRPRTPYLRYHAEFLKAVRALQKLFMDEHTEEI